MILDGFFYFEIVSNLEGVIIVQRISMSYLLRFLVVDILPSPYHFVSIFIHISIYIFFFFSEHFENKLCAKCPVAS